jgi:hypothetical protein
VSVKVVHRGAAALIEHACVFHPRRRRIGMTTA